MNYLELIVPPKSQNGDKCQIFITKCLHFAWSMFKSEISAQRGEGYPADIRGSFARISRPKSSVRALKILENKHLGADIHDPKARTSKTALLRPFNWLLGAIFLGGQNGIFRASKCTFWNSKISGSVWGRGYRNSGSKSHTRRRFLQLDTSLC